MHTQSGNITTTLKVKIYFILPQFGATTIVMWDCCVDDSSKSRCENILRIYLREDLVFNQKFSEQIIEADYGALKE